MKKEKKQDAKLTTISAIGIAIATLITVWSVYIGITNWNPPVYFPLNDPQGEYLIMKTNTTYSLAYKTKADNITTTLCDVNIIGLKTNCRTKTIKEFIIDIANAPVPLDEFLNEKVIVTGNFTYTNKQCIEKVCKPHNEFAGLNIKTITKKI